MEIFVYLALSIAVFQQFIPPQLCSEIQTQEIVTKDKNLTINLNFVINNDHLEEENTTIINLPQNRIENTSITCFENFCENVPNYPLDEITNAVKNLHIKAFSGFQGDTMEVQNRHSIADGIPLCEPILRILHPQMGTNTENKEKYIVNIPGLEQGLIVTTCGKVERCGKAIIPPGIVARCRQRYSLVRLLSFDTENGAEGFQPKYDIFPFPSCCVCTLSKP